LGLDPDVPPTMVFPDEPSEVFRLFYEAKGEEAASGASSWAETKIDAGAPWTLEEYPMFVDWIKEIDAPLDVIAEAIRQPVFFMPLLQCPVMMQTGDLFFNVHPDALLSRRIARLFQARATYRIGRGDIDGALDDQRSLLRLGRLIAHSGTQIHRLSGISVEAIARMLPVGGNPEHPLTEQQIHRILDALDTLPPPVPLAEVYEWERFTMLSAWQTFAFAIARGELLPAGLGDSSLPIDHAHPRTINLNIIFRRLNEMFDAMQEPPPRTKFYALKTEMGEMTQQLESLTVWGRLAMWVTPGSRDRALANLFTWILTEPIDFGIRAPQYRLECSDNLQRLALAVLLHQLEHGTMPGENWAVQIEKYLGENPEQYFSCPSNPAPRGSTTYALVLYGDAVPGSLMLIELPEAVPFDKAVITVEEMVELCRISIEQGESVCCGQVRIVERAVSRVKAHPNGMNVAHRNGAVRFMPQTIAKEELLWLLGREKNNVGE